MLHAVNHSPGRQLSENSSQKPPVRFPPRSGHSQMAEIPSAALTGFRRLHRDTPNDRYTLARDAVNSGR